MLIAVHKFKTNNKSNQIINTVIYQFNFKILRMHHHHCKNWLAVRQALIF